jgi:pimeloyl-ACP methyl ester carboxylesterase
MEHRTIATPAGRLSVHDTGGTLPAVLLWPSIFMDRHAFDDVARALGDRWRIVVVEGPGHGASAPPPERLDMADCGRAMLAVMDALDLRDAVLGGTSWGAIAAAEAGLAAPDRVRALILMNMPTGAGDRGLGHRFIVAGARWMAGFGFFRNGVARSFFATEPRRETDRMARFHDHLAGADRRALSSAVAAVLHDRKALAPRLHQLRMPVLGIAGEHDTMYAAAETRAAFARIPRHLFIVLPTRHISLSDAPGPTIAAIEAFLANPEGVENDRPD